MLKLEHLGIQSFTRLVVLTAGLFSLGVSCRAVDSPESTSAELRSCESGETTATYLAEKIHLLGCRVTRIGYGVPMGGDIEYTDELTLTRALEGRREI